MEKTNELHEVIFLIEQIRVHLALMIKPHLE